MLLNKTFDIVTVSFYNITIIYLKDQRLNLYLILICIVNILANITRSKLQKSRANKNTFGPGPNVTYWTAY